MKRPPDDRNGELRALFFETTGEILQSLNEAGLELEARPADKEVVRRIRRLLHTLKGDSAACGLHKLSELSHELEDALTPGLAQHNSAAFADIVLCAADHFSATLSAYQKQWEPPPAHELRALIHAVYEEPKKAPDPPEFSNRPSSRFAWTEYEQLMISESIHRGESVFNVALKVDASSLMRAAAFQLIRNVLHGCGTVIALRPEDSLAAASVELVEAAVASKQSEKALAQRCRIPSIVSEVQVERVAACQVPEHHLMGDLLEAQSAQVAASEKESNDSAAKETASTSTAANVVSQSTLRVDASRIDSAMNLVGELIIGKSMLNRALAEFGKTHARDPVAAKLADAVAFQSRVLDELHKCVLKIRMVPVEQLFRRFPRIVRDVAKLCGKDVALTVSGENTDLDKGILDSLSEPIMHLVRNAVDHGIESAPERLAAGKPARGTISLNAYHQGTQVVIDVRDDGRGIDPAQIRIAAKAKKLLSDAELERISEQDLLNLIFESGFTTASEITEVSGRGIGMDVVRNVLERLKGSVSVASQKELGATFQLRVPLTLASVQTLLFRVGGRLFAVPLSSVVEITRISEPEITRVDQREVLRLREQILTLVRLNQLSRLQALDSVPAKKNKFVVVIGAAEKRFGLLVDALVGEEELVIKALPGEIVASDLVSGASILGDGTVVLILNVPSILSRLSRAIPLGAIA